MRNQNNLDFSRLKPNILLGVTGGIAAYKSIEICRRLVTSGFHVMPVLTQSALEMVGAKTFDALASERTRLDLWNEVEPSPHTYLGQKADLILVCPATARVISDLRTGRTADLLTASVVASRAPIIICPAMHTEMWENTAVQENIQVLKSRGYIIVPPEEGELAGGDIGVGRLANLDQIISTVQQSTNHFNILSGKNVLVTAGGTREAIDPVRFIGNRSTGLQGHSIAEVANSLGANVTLITTSDIESSIGIKRIEVDSSSEMLDVVIRNLSSNDIMIMVAAVSDFKPVQISSQKIKKATGLNNIDLEPTKDILCEIASRRSKDQIIVGFAAETENALDNAKSKLKDKNLDYIVVNDVLEPGAGFGSLTNIVQVLGSDGSVQKLELSDKTDIAKSLFQIIVSSN